MEKFKSLGLSRETLEALQLKGFEEPTPIQSAIIPLLLTGDKDIVGQAQTGTGKTAAFGLPMIEKIKSSKNVSALVLVPTRELAIQVAEEINSLQGQKKLSVVPIYGGQAIEQQLWKLKKGIDIVVGTPGRVLDHIRRKRLILKDITYLVLDEADEMLNMGFIEEVEEIISHVNTDRRTLLFSATMPKEILTIAKKHMGDYKLIKAEKDQIATPLIDQIYFQVSEADKFEALCRIIDMEKEFYGLVFCRTKNDVDNVTSHLLDRGYDADALHGDISQQQREKVLNKFRKQNINILIATDVAARGIDVQNLTHVINFALPQDPESYVHRIGRTGRAGKLGTAVTFVTSSEYNKIMRIQKFAKTEIRKEKLPRVRDIIRARKKRIKEDVLNHAGNEIEEEFLKIAAELLQDNDPERLLAAMLKYSFQEELDASNYKELSGPEKERSADVDQKGKTRLFIALGNKDKMTEKKLINFIKTGIKIKDYQIKNIKIFEEYSFVTVPFQEAEMILDMFNTKRKKGEKPIVEKAKQPGGAK